MRWWLRARRSSAAASDHTAVERGGSGGELFDGGIEYQFSQDEDTMIVSVTPDGDATLVMIRVLP